MTPWTIEFERSAVKALKTLHPEATRKISIFLEMLRAQALARTIGEPLYGENKGLWRYRVGDYRLICRLEDHVLRIVVIKIGHRREIDRT